MKTILPVIFLSWLCMNPIVTFAGDRNSVESETLICEGLDAEEGLRFWYDIQIKGENVESRLTTQRGSSGMFQEEIFQSRISEGKFAVQSPYSDLKARIAYESEDWILDLMEMNGDFVIPTYDGFGCLVRGSSFFRVR